MKETVLMKYGGATLATIGRIQKVANYVAKVAQTRQVVVVVSAMGDETDKLLKAVVKLYPRAVSRHDPESDKCLATGEAKSASLLALAVTALRMPKGRASSLSGLQIQLETDARHGRARVKSVRGVDRIKQLLARDGVAVISGFQGVAEGSDEVTILGRGGSDLTAVALADALGLDECYIFKDSDGVHTVDPRLVPHAKRFSKISYESMLQLSLAGSGVLMDRCVRLAQAHGIKMRVLLSPSIGKTKGGTLVCSGSTPEDMEGGLVETGIAVQEAVLIRVAGVPNLPGAARTVLSALSDVNILDGFQDYGTTTQAGISFLFAQNEAADASLKLSQAHTGRVRPGIEVTGLTLVQPLLKENPQYLNHAVRALALAGVNIEMIYFLASAGTILLVVRREDTRKAVLALAKEFNLLDTTR